MDKSFNSVNHALSVLRRHKDVTKYTRIDDNLFCIKHFSHYIASTAAVEAFGYFYRNYNHFAVYRADIGYSHAFNLSKKKQSQQ